MEQKSNLFRTTFDIKEASNQIDYRSNILLLGSCFSENMGKILCDLKFNAINNPFGVIYNPISISKILKRILENKPYTDKDLIWFQGQWISYNHHGTYRSSNPERLLKDLNLSLKAAHVFLKSCTHLVLTPGTAKVYQLSTTGEVVANCHKLPHDYFTQHILTVNEALVAWHSIINLLKDLPSLQIIFTTSPVRHWRDGAIENQHSKSVLNTSIHELIAHHQDKCSYFPSYELMMDDLRDYRFYAEDMLHPSKVAIDYIWERFKNTWVNASCYPAFNDIIRLHKSMMHRPIKQVGENYITFLKNNLNKIIVFESKYPHLNLSEEKKEINKRIVDIL